MPNVPDLHPVAADTGRQLFQGTAKPQPPLTNAVWTCNAATSYQLNSRCQDFITRYLGRSLISVDDPNMKRVNHKLLKLAFIVSHPAGFSKGLWIESIKYGVCEFLLIYHF